MSITRNNTNKRAAFRIVATDVDGKAMLVIWWGQLVDGVLSPMRLVGMAPDTQSMRRKIQSNLEMSNSTDLWLEPEVRNF